MYKKIFFLLSISVFCVMSSLAQEVKFDDPRVAKFTIFGDIPVSHSTGIPDISIPLFNIKSHGFELPVMLRYHPSLVKPPYDQTNIATGWVLEVGGNITQRANGVNDLHDKRPSQWKTSEDLYDQWDPDVQEFLENVLIKEIDTQYDIFSYSILGKNGDFLLTKNNESVFELNFLSDPLFKGSLVGYEQIVTPSTSFVLESIDILDDSGYRYVFPEKFKDQVGLDGNNVTRHLEKIIDPFGNQLFVFDYQTITYPAPNVYPFSTMITTNSDPNFDWTTGDPDCNEIIPNLTENYFFRQFDGDYISNSVKKISFDTGYLEFYLSEDNSHITEVKLFDNSESGQYIQRYVFEYGLFPGAGYRYLDKVVSMGKNGVSDSVYEFEYFEGESSNIESSSVHTDYWGYLNGINDNLNGNIDLGSKLISNFKSCLNQLIDLNIGSGSKDPSLVFTKTFTLSSIKYPTGGKTVFDFELNELNNSKFGGLRVKSIIEYNSEEIEVRRKIFEYNTGTLNINYVGPQPFHPSLVLVDVPDANFDYRPYGYYYQKTYSDNFYTSFGINTPRYISVTQYLVDTVNINIGKTEFYYNFFNQNVVRSLVDRRDFSFYDNQVYSNNPIEFHHNYIDEYRAWGNGLLSERIDYKKTESGYEEMQRETYTYKFHDDTTFNNLDILKLLTHRSFSGDWLSGYYMFRNDFVNQKYPDGSYIWTKYSLPYPDPVVPFDSFIKKGAYKLESKVVRSTFENGTIENLETRHYDNGLMQEPSHTTWNNSKGEETVSFYTYPYNSTLISTGISSGTIDIMKAKNILTPIVKEEKHINGNQVYGKINLYEINEHGNVSISMIKDYSRLGDYEIRLNYKYDSKGNPIMVSKEGGTITSYFWGYEKQYPIAKVEGASYGQIATALGTTEGNLENFTEANLSQLNGLRSSLPGAMVTTYTYQPLVGMTSQTDPNGLVTFYEYDDFGRLETIRDHEGNVLETYEYSYATNN